jgi:hypothetical protein
MLDPRLYRAALAPILFALILAAFSLEDLPRPLRSTLAPDAFEAHRAFRDLQGMVSAFPNRRPGDASDEALAQRVASSLRSAGLPGGPRPFSVRMARLKGETIDGQRELVNVIARRAGIAAPQIVVVAHRDAAKRGSAAELSGTAALVELGRVLAAANVRRTITLVSTSGGSGGDAGARAIAQQLGGGPIDAVVVLGDMASARVHHPLVISYSNSGGVAPVKLTRTVQDAVAVGTASDAGGPRAVTQWARLALPLTISEQGEIGASGLPGVLLSAYGERTPPANARVTQASMQRFGRAALRAVQALDSGPDIGGAPTRALITQRKVLPEWSVRLLVAALLLAPLLAAIDGFARLRRRHEPIARGLLWVLGTALPFVLAFAFVVALGATGLLVATPRAPVPPGAIPVNGIALMSAALIFVLGWIVVRPLVVRIARVEGAPQAPATAGALLIVLAALAAVMWVVNPYAAALLVPALHAWLLIVAPGVRLRRAAALGLLVIGLLPFLALVVADARSIGMGPLDTAWMATLMIAGGGFGFATWFTWSLIGAVSIGVAAIALRPPPAQERPGAPDVTVRGPVTYAGPGSLGGTESALRR